jgi:Xaa-Pro dipeptidase
MNTIYIPGSNDEWRKLHSEHIRELKHRYDDIFKRFSALDAIVIHSGYAVKKNSSDDQYWPTAPTPHFVHWTPYNSTPALLILKPATKPELWIERHTSYWEGAGPENPEWDSESFTINWLDDLKSVAVPKSHTYVGDDSSVRSSTAWAEANARDVVAAMDATRTAKTSYEISCIRAANISALRGHARLAELFLVGGHIAEISLHHEYLRMTAQTDFSVPYGNIVGIGAHAAILHHVHYDRTERFGDLSLLVDAGDTRNGYASDITRTYVRGKTRGAEKFAELIAGVEQLQKKLCDKFVVGVDYQDLHNHSHELVAKLLVDLKISSAPVEDLVTSGATRCLFPHGLGHSLGIQVHDVGMKLRKSGDDNPYLRNTSVITAGQVVTVEPGIYFIPALIKNLRDMKIANTFDWTSCDELMPFGGIRIEDNMLATKDGPVNLTRG